MMLAAALLERALQRFRLPCTFLAASEGVVERGMTPPVSFNAAAASADCSARLDMVRPNVCTFPGPTPWNAILTRRSRSSLLDTFSLIRSSADGC